MDCPCGSALPASACCEPYYQQQSLAPTAEALMRSRFSAYATQHFAYIIATTHPRRGQVPSLDQLLDSGQHCQWTRLDITRVIAGQTGQQQGVVEFSAHYQLLGEAKVLTESSLFVFEAERWWYVDGSGKTALPKKRQPCLCGSGIAFKNCCGR